jgi:PAS domain S-box-containing protein
MSSRKSKVITQLLPYVITLLAVGSAILLTLILRPFLAPSPHQLFFLAVMVSAWAGGLRQGLLATVLSTLVVNYFFTQPYYSLDIINSASVIRLSTFVVVAAIISWLNQSRKNALRKAKDSLQALRQSEARFGSLAGSNIIGMAVFDLDGLVLEANNAFLELVGYTQEDLRSGQVRWRDITPPEYQQVSEQCVQDLRSTGVCAPFEQEYIYKDGSRVPVLIGSVIGEENTATGFVLDLSERKKAKAAQEEASRREQALYIEAQAARERLEDVLAGINDQFFVLDQEWRYTYVNDRVVEVVGMPRADLLGQCVWELFPDIIDTSLYVEAHRSVAEQTQVQLEFFYPSWQRWFESHIYPSGNGVAMLAIDITDRKRIEEERKQAEAILRESEARFRQMADAAPVLIWMSGTDKLCHYFNQPWLDFTGRTLDQEMGNGWAEGVHPDDVRYCLDTYVTAFDARQPFQMEYRFRRFDGVYRWILSASVPRYTSEEEFLGYIGSCIDIEDRKQMEEARRESEERFRTLADNISQLVWMTDASGWVYWYNQRWFDYTGTTLEEVQGWGWQKVHHPEYVDRVTKRLRHFFEIGEPWEDTFPLRGKDGIYRWFLSRALPIRDETGRIQSWFGTNTDVTDRQQAEEALRDSESRFRLMMESAKEYAIFTMDMEGHVINWNAGAKRLLGYCEAEIVGQNYQILFTPEDVAQGLEKQEMQNALQEGGADDARWHQRRDGSRFWANGLSMPLLDEAGQVQGFMKILRDMTKEKQASERLQLLYETASDLLTAEQPLVLMNSLLSKLSVQMGLQFYVQYFMEQDHPASMLQLVSFNGLSEVTVHPLRQLALGEGICGCVAQQQHQMLLNDVQQSTLPNAQTLRSIGVTAYASQPLIVQGRLLGTLAFGSFTRTEFTSEEASLLQAISDQVAVAIDRANLTASLRQQAEQLSHANRIKDEFLAVLSHELRTPLNPILGWSKLLRTRKYDEATVNRALETIQRNAQLQTQLIEDLLDVSRILQGKLSLKVSPISWNFIIPAALETVRLAAEAKAIQIQPTIEPNVGQVLGDAGRLQQVVWNLLSNAVKFTPQGGQVSIKLEQVENQAQVTVSDTGKGVTAEFLPYVFDYFRQADSATTRKFGGLGLGLAIVRQIVELHGGTVWVESPGEDQGATFVVRLPLLNAKPEKSQEENQSLSQTSEGSSLAGLRILVVDDEIDSRNFTAFVLEQEQAEVMTLSSAWEALQELEQYNPDVLLTDIGMPDMDGYMLIRQVRTRPPEQGGQVVAIALTAYAGDFDQQQALQAGFQYHLSKPIEPDELIKTIAALPRRASQG